MNRFLRSRGARSLLILCAGAVLSAATWVAFRHGVASTSELPALGTVPEFSLLSSTGQPLSQRDLAGGVWIADFIFTRCASICPTLSAQMAKLQTALAASGDAQVRLVSFSVDPAHDTPEVLREYAGRFHADPARWVFLTGDRNRLYQLIGDGFHLAVADRAPDENADGGGLITHSDRFVLVDAQLNIRGYYHGTEPDSVQQLLRDLKKLTPSAVGGQQSADR